MAPPPSKRQKRRIIVSSDEEEDLHASERYRDPSVISDRVRPRDQVRLASINGTTTNRSLPTRSRTKPNSVLNSGSIIITTPTSPNLTEELPRRLKTTQNTRKKESLHEYFNAVNRGQTKQEVQPEVEAPGFEVEEEDVIEDDSLDEELQHVSSTQNWPTSTNDARSRLVVPTGKYAGSSCSVRSLRGSQRFLRAGTVTGKSAPSKPATDTRVDLRPWAEKYAPTGLEELMVHKKKVADVRDWLERAFLGRERKVVPHIFLLGHDMLTFAKQLLILKGPSGAGKTATISTLATAMDFGIAEWRNPINSDYSSEGYLSVSAQFEEFIGRSGKFDSLSLTGDRIPAVSLPQATPSLLAGSAKKKIILLEEFPSTFMSASAALRSFRSNILQLLAPTSCGKNATPVILIITETYQTATTASNDSFTAHRLLGPELLTHSSTTIIEFNPIAATLLTKALDLVIQKEARHSGRRRIPGPSVLKRLGEVGDVRSAIGSLEFLCVKADDGEDWGGRVASRGNKGSSALTKMECKSLELVTQREASLGIFHAVGKVVYNKRDEPSVVSFVPQTPEHLRHYTRPMVSQVSLDDLLCEIGTDIGTFVAALHENYILSCESLSFTDSFNGCIDALSDSDLLNLDRCFSFINPGLGSDSLRQDEITFHVAVGGLLFALPCPVKRRATNVGKGTAFKMLWPASMRVARKKEEVESLIDTWHGRRQARVGIPTSLPVGSQVADRDPADELDLHQNQPHVEPFRTGISSTKDELILERLPYTAKIAPGNSQLEEITKFYGIDKAVDEGVNEDGEDSTLTGVSLSKTSAVSGRLDSARNTQATGAGLPDEAAIGKLYVSDDDIEDE